MKVNLANREKTFPEEFRKTRTSGEEGTNNYWDLGKLILTLGSAKKTDRNVQTQQILTCTYVPNKAPSQYSQELT